MEIPELTGQPGPQNARERIVLDANVLVSAIIFPRSIPGQVLTQARKIGILLTTDDLIAELHDVLARPKFDRYVARDLRDEFLATYIIEAEFVLVSEAITMCRDPKDDCVLEAAVNGRATCVVSGDADLLVLTPFCGVSILRPAEFLSRYDSPPPVP